VKPVLQAMVLADQVYQDRTTGKMIIAGTFTKLIRRRPQASPPTGGPVLPPGYQSGSPHAYLRLTEIHGSAQLELRFVELSSDKTLFSAQLDVRSQDPLQSVELNVPLPSLPLSQPGIYSLEVHSSGELLGAWNITLEDQSGPTWGPATDPTPSPPNEPPTGPPSG
jgi:hypothetical protein